MPVHVSPGTVLVFRNPDFEDQEAVAKMIQDFYRTVARENGVPAGTEAAAVCPLIVWLFGDSTLETLNEDEMAAAGWVRKP